MRIPLSGEGRCAAQLTVSRACERRSGEAHRAITIASAARTSRLKSRPSGADLTGDSLLASSAIVFVWSPCSDACTSTGPVADALAVVAEPDAWPLHSPSPLTFKLMRARLGSCSPSVSSVETPWAFEGVILIFGPPLLGCGLLGGVAAGTCRLILIGVALTGGGGGVGDCLLLRLLAGV